MNEHTAQQGVDLLNKSLGFDSSEIPAPTHWKVVGPRFFGVFDSEESAQYCANLILDCTVEPCQVNQLPRIASHGKYPFKVRLEFMGVSALRGTPMDWYHRKIIQRISCLDFPRFHIQPSGDGHSMDFYVWADTFEDAMNIADEMRQTTVETLNWMPVRSHTRAILNHIIAEDLASSKNPASPPAVPDLQASHQEGCAPLP